MIGVTGIVFIAAPGLASAPLLSATGFGAGGITAGMRHSAKGLATMDVLSLLDSVFYRSTVTSLSIG
jgi:hypothetical protein